MGTYRTNSNFYLYIQRFRTGQFDTTNRLWTPWEAMWHGETISLRLEVESNVLKRNFVSTPYCYVRTDIGDVSAHVHWRVLIHWCYLNVWYINKKWTGDWHCTCFVHVTANECNFILTLNHLFSIGSSGRVGGAKKHEIYVAAFGGHLFYDLFVQGWGGGGPWPPRHPLDPLLLLRGLS